MFSAQRFDKIILSPLPQFLLSVDWRMEAHANEAVKLMRDSWATLR
jgi:hypothetical protein